MNGTRPTSRGSLLTKPPLIGANVLSNTEMPVLLAAYSLALAPVPAIASPVSTPPGVARTTAVVPALPFHAEIVPLRLAKMKFDAVPLTVKVPAPALLNTWPVGPCGPLAVVGMLTTRACGAAIPLVTRYRVDVLVAWFEIQNGLVALNDMPQGFLRFGSVTCASPGTSDTRLVCT